jgi:branched-chain amino acid transport system permease protein
VNLLLQLLANGIVNGAMFAVLAVGFGLVYRSIGVFHVAYGGVFVLAAYVFHSLVTVAGLGWWSAGVVAVGLSGLFGWAMEGGFYGPFYRRGTAHGAVMVASLGLGIVIENGLALVYGNEIRAIPRDLAGAVTLGPVRLTTIQVGQLVLCAVVLAGLAVANRLRFFRVVRAMGENPELLQMHGWRLGRYRALVFALSGALAAVPACLMMTDVGMDVHAGMSYLLLAAVAVLAGGIARMEGWVLGGVALAVLQSLVVWKFSAKWMDLVAFVLLLAVLLFRREGLMGMRKRREEA